MAEITRNHEQEISEVKWLKHYNSNHHILLVGEGDFSFSVSLAMAFGSASNVVATSLDSYDILIKKFRRAKTNLELLASYGAKLLHGVDVMKMKLHIDLQRHKFDRIIYNFPHAGFLGKENNPRVIMKHRILVFGFFENASGMLRSRGEVHVTHKTTSPYQSWNIEELATQHSLVLLECIEFKLEDYPGYNNKRGDGKCSDKPFPLQKCSTFKFIRSSTTKKSTKTLRQPQEISSQRVNATMSILDCMKQMDDNIMHAVHMSQKEEKVARVEDERRVPNTIQKIRHRPSTNRREKERKEKDKREKGIEGAKVDEVAHQTEEARHEKEDRLAKEAYLREKGIRKAKEEETLRRAANREALNQLATEKAKKVVAFASAPDDEEKHYYERPGRDAGVRLEGSEDVGLEATSESVAEATQGQANKRKKRIRKKKMKKSTQSCIQASLNKLAFEKAKKAVASASAPGIRLVDGEDASLEAGGANLGVATAKVVVEPTQGQHCKRKKQSSKKKMISYTQSNIHTLRNKLVVEKTKKATVSTIALGTPGLVAEATQGQGRKRRNHSNKKRIKKSTRSDIQVSLKKLSTKNAKKGAASATAPDEDEESYSKGPSQDVRIRPEGGKYANPESRGADVVVATTKIVDEATQAQGSKRNKHKNRNKMKKSTQSGIQASLNKQVAKKAMKAAAFANALDEKKPNLEDPEGDVGMRHEGSEYASLEVDGAELGVATTVVVAKATQGHGSKRRKQNSKKKMNKSPQNVIQTSLNKLAVEKARKAAPCASATDDEEEHYSQAPGEDAGIRPEGGEDSGLGVAINDVVAKARQAQVSKRKSHRSRLKMKKSTQNSIQASLKKLAAKNAKKVAGSASAPDDKEHYSQGPGGDASMRPQGGENTSLGASVVDLGLVTDEIVADATQGQGSKRKKHSIKKKRKKSIRSGIQASSSTEEVRAEIEMRCINAEDLKYQYDTATFMPNSMKSKVAVDHMVEALQVDDRDAEQAIALHNLPADFDGESVEDKREVFDVILPSRKLNHGVHTHTLEVMDQDDTSMSDSIAIYQKMWHWLVNAIHTISRR